MDNIGRIKTKLVKRVSTELHTQYPEEFKDNFEENKKIAEKLADIPSKKLRNVIAGYAVRLKKQGLEPKARKKKPIVPKRSGRRNF